MANLIQQASQFLTCRTSLKQFQRFRGKINIQRPRIPHYDRQLVLAVTQPKYKEKPKQITCFKPNPNSPQVIHNPYNDIIAREVRNWLEQSRAVAIFHLNSITQDELFPTRVLLHKQNMHLKSYGRKIITKAVENSRFEAIIPLFESQHCMVFSSEPKIKQLLRITRKVPQLILMAGIVEDRLLSRNELIAYAEMPGLEAAQAELVQTLNMAAGNLVQQLEAHQNNFVNILDVYAKSDSTEASNNDESKSKDETAEEKNT